MREPILLACDLDGTLFHGRLRRKEGDICVNRAGTKALSFMSPEECRALAALPDTVRLVAVTTRTAARYRRIAWPEGCEPEYAVVSNGAVLLRRGEPVPDWAPQERDGWKAACSAAKGFLAPWCEERGAVLFSSDGYFLRIAAADRAQAKAWAAEIGDRAGLPVMRSGSALYFLPPGVDKGAALARLRKRFSPPFAIAAGDGVRDLPMLRAADLALVPKKTLAEKCAPARTGICPAGADFSLFLLARAAEEGEAWSRT